METLKVVFENIEKFYELNKHELLEDDKLRPCKSITRDIFSSVNKFKEYFILDKKRVISKEEIMRNVLSFDGMSDTVNTNIRVMLEFGFLHEIDNENYEFTTNFIKFINSEAKIEEYFENELQEISSLSNINMIYNSILCVLREGYIYDEILVFPDSKGEFHNTIKSKDERLKYCYRVKELYGFCGRRKDVDSDDYTPNANYRIITVVKNMGYIKSEDSESVIKKFSLTKKGLLLLKKIDLNLSHENHNVEKTYSLPEEFSHNRIIFGAPGTGKSYLLEMNRKYFGENYERVTFHPNYTYAQFVGTYKPVPIKDTEGNDTITYQYVPGPFMRILVKALRSINDNTNQPYLLLIEEINRANVAGVFGDVFQLLDRKDGESEYSIATSEDVQLYLKKELGGELSDYDSIKIPHNMYIWATMNSADQGVFPMDTAFKRRWDFEYISINNNEEGIEGIKILLGEDKHIVEWNALRKAINNILLNVCKVNEDKLLGPYFISKSILQVGEDGLLINNSKFIDVFKNKVLMYLYEDAAGRQHRSKMFSNCTPNSTYSMICEEFDRLGECIFQDGIDLSKFKNSKK